MLLCMGSVAFAQSKKSPTLDQIFKEGIFRGHSVYGINWMKDGQYYSKLVREMGAEKVVKMDIQTGQPVGTLVSSKVLTDLLGKELHIDGYHFSADEQKVLIETEHEAIYRRSSKSHYFVYDRQANTVVPLAKGEKQSFATFSPDGKMVAFVRSNNLYVTNLSDMKEQAITTDGQFNSLLHGMGDWVYEEEFSLAKAFKWAPDSKSIAYLSFDESEVKQYTMPIYGTLYPQQYTFKYPKAGERNSEVFLSVYHLDNQKSTEIQKGKEKDIYIPRIYWSADGKSLSYIWMNRLQNHLELRKANAFTGEYSLLLKETSKTYVDLDFNDQIYFLKDGSFIRTSEESGFKHIYLFNKEGQQLRQITNGQWEVSSIVGVDKTHKKIYYLSKEESTIADQFYVIGFNGKGKKKLSTREGNHSVNFSNDFKYYIQYQSNIHQPLRVTLHNAKGKELKVLEDNQAQKATFDKFDLGHKEFMTVKAADGQTDLNAYMIKPSNFDASKKYPVLMFVYGGPGSQMVQNKFPSYRDAWYGYLANQGYLIVCVDNRGTGGKGRDFKHITYKDLGKYESEDQIYAAKQLAKKSFVDAERIGIWGWSFGGYMSSLCLMKGNDIFKTAIAVAPVTNWRYYDSIYTERYQSTPQLNPHGYDDNSPVFHVDQLKGNFLLVHGTADDNVHFQNAVELENALISANKQFRTFYYPNRNHGIYGDNATRHLYTMMTNFLLEKL
ncbi:peptidase S9 [Persicobacter psychrovividus]|uniref:Peptidase S9 n=2 Tax=Persicobacter psychrovividus TaxID=387638 RepID=A0ABM7VEH8_9BACT|nr:peptidase S9 [Persicobacter psychrovividus]